MLTCLLDFLLKSSNSVKISMSNGMSPKLIIRTIRGYKYYASQTDNPDFSPNNYLSWLSTPFNDESA